MENLLSVVIITCNRKDEIIKTISSCLEHSNKEIEFVIVDNDSHDNTEVAVKEFLEKVTRASLTYIKLNSNTGVSHARNVGYKAAKGDILFFIDDDAVVTSESNSLDFVSDYMRDNDNVLAATGNSHDYRYGGYLNFCKDRTEKKDDLYNIRSYVGFNHFIKKEFTRKDFIYPDNLFYGSEELYVGFSVIKEDGKTIFFQSHSVQHNPSTNTRIDRHEGLRNGHINTYVIKKYFLPTFFQCLSWLIFTARIIRFSKGNFNEIRECLRLANDRYDKKYENKMSLSTTIMALRKFGVFRVL